MPKTADLRVRKAANFDMLLAGINIGPNLGRLLDRWNVLDIALAEGVALQEARIVGENAFSLTRRRTLRSA